MLLLDAASGRFDLRACAGAHLHAANGYGARQIAICQHLGRTLSLVDQPDVSERLLGNFHSLGQTIQIVQPNDLVLDAKDIRETALWQPPRERHLAALELGLPSARAMVARARLDSLVTLARGFPRPRTGTAPKALAIPVRARRCYEIVKPDPLGTGDDLAALPPLTCRLSRHSSIPLPSSLRSGDERA